METESVLRKQKQRKNYDVFRQSLATDPAKQARRRKQNRHAMRKYAQKRKLDPEKMELIREQNRQNQRKRRGKLNEDPDKREAYLERKRLETRRFREQKRTLAMSAPLAKQAAPTARVAAQSLPPLDLTAVVRQRTATEALTNAPHTRVRATPRSAPAPPAQFRASAPPLDLTAVIQQGTQFRRPRQHVSMAPVVTMRDGEHLRLANPSNAVPSEVAMKRAEKHMESMFVLGGRAAARRRTSRRA